MSQEGKDNVLAITLQRDPHMDTISDEGIVAKLAPKTKNTRCLRDTCFN